MAFPEIFRLDGKVIRNAAGNIVANPCPVGCGCDIYIIPDWNWPAAAPTIVVSWTHQSLIRPYRNEATGCDGWDPGGADAYVETNTSGTVTYTPHPTTYRLWTPSTSTVGQIKFQNLDLTLSLLCEAYCYSASNNCVMVPSSTVGDLDCAFTGGCTPSPCLPSGDYRFARSVNDFCAINPQQIYETIATWTRVECGTIYDPETYGETSAKTCIGLWTGGYFVYEPGVGWFYDDNGASYDSTTCSTPDGNTGVWQWGALEDWGDGWYGRPAFIYVERPIAGKWGCTDANEALDDTGCDGKAQEQCDDITSADVPSDPTSFPPDP